MTRRLHDGPSAEEEKIDQSLKARSIVAELKLLRVAIDSPDNIDVELREKLLSVLVSQSGLARFDWEPLHIIGMALNTHKVIANKILDGCYQMLNEYRKAALARLLDTKHRDQSPKRGTNEFYKEQLLKQQNKIKHLQDEIAIMSQKLDDYLLFAHQVAVETGRLDIFKDRQINLLKKYYKGA